MASLVVAVVVVVCSAHVRQHFLKRQFVVCYWLARVYVAKWFPFYFLLQYTFHGLLEVYADWMTQHPIRSAPKSLLFISTSLSLLCANPQIQ